MSLFPIVLINVVYTMVVLFCLLIGFFMYPMVINAYGMTTQKLVLFVILVLFLSVIYFGGNFMAWLHIAYQNPQKAWFYIWLPHLIITLLWMLAAGSMLLLDYFKISL